MGKPDATPVRCAKDSPDQSTVVTAARHTARTKGRGGGIGTSPEEGARWSTLCVAQRGPSIPQAFRGRPMLRPSSLQRSDAPGKMSPLSPDSFHVERAIARCLLGSLPLLARDDVRGVPIRPVVLRSGRFVLTVMLLCFFEKLCQGRDVRAAQSPSGEARLDLLEQPGVAVGIAESGQCGVGATLRGGAWHGG